MAKVAGVILAGGMSSRMGGGDKSLKKIGQQTILQTVIDRIQPQVATLALNTNNDPAQYSAYELPVISDRFEHRLGPLAGILSGMAWAQEKGFPFIVTVAGDSPFFPLNLVAQLTLNQVQNESSIVLAGTRDDKGGIRRHPTFGLWSVDLRKDLQASLLEGVRKIVLWTERHNSSEALFPSDHCDPFFNINTPEDLIMAQHLATRM